VRRRVDFYDALPYILLGIIGVTYGITTLIGAAR